MKLYGISKAVMDECRELLAGGFHHDNLMGTLRNVYERNKSLANSPVNTLTWNWKHIERKAQ